MPIRILIQQSNFTETTLILGRILGVKPTEEKGPVWKSIFHIYERSRGIWFQTPPPEDLREWGEMRTADVPVETLKAVMCRAYRIVYGAGQLVYSLYPFIRIVASSLLTETGMMIAETTVNTGTGTKKILLLETIVCTMVVRLMNDMDRVREVTSPPKLAD
jgi:hypothetical protein